MARAGAAPDNQPDDNREDNDQPERRRQEHLELAAVVAHAEPRVVERAVARLVLLAPAVAAAVVVFVVLLALVAAVVAIFRALLLVVVMRGWRVLLRCVMFLRLLIAVIIIVAAAAAAVVLLLVVVMHVRRLRLLSRCLRRRRHAHGFEHWLPTRREERNCRLIRCDQCAAANRFWQTTCATRGHLSVRIAACGGEILACDAFTVRARICATKRRIAVVRGEAETDTARYRLTRRVLNKTLLHWTCAAADGARWRRSRRLGKAHTAEQHGALLQRHRRRAETLRLRERARAPRALFLALTRVGSGRRTLDRIQVLVEIRAHQRRRRARELARARRR